MSFSFVSEDWLLFV